MLTKDKAICIRALDYSETSQVVTFFTRSTGKISAIAKGSKRPKSAFDGPIEIFSFGRIVFTAGAEEKLAILTEFEQQGGLGRLSSDIFVLNCAHFAAELLDSLTEDYNPNPQLFDSFQKFLENICLASAKTEAFAFLILFQLALLKHLGLQPILKTCVNCKNSFTSNWRQSYFSSSANGLVCKDCEASFADKIRISLTAAGCLSNFKNIADADETTLKEIEKLLISHFTQLLHRKPKMAKYIVGSSSAG